MILLYILLAVIVFICLILLLNIRVIIEYGDSVYFGICVLGLKFKLAPTKQKKKKESTKKKLKKQKNTGNNKKSVLSEFTDDLEISDFLELLKYLLQRIYKHSLGHIKVKIKRLEITVGDEYADRAALTFGAVNAGVSWLIEYFDNNTKLTPLEGRNIYVRCDFDSVKTTAIVIMEFKIRLVHLVISAMNFFFDFIKLKESKTNIISERKYKNERK